MFSVVLIFVLSVEDCTVTLCSVIWPFVAAVQGKVHTNDPLKLIY